MSLHRFRKDVEAALEKHGLAKRARIDAWVLAFFVCDALKTFFDVSDSLHESAFEEGAAVAVGLIGMGQAIRDGEDAKRRQRDHQERVLEADMGQ